MALIDLATINFAGRGGASPGTKDPDFNLDYNQDFRAPVPEDEDNDE